MPEKMQSLDEFNKQLLRLMQQNNRFTADELGAKVGLSASAGYYVTGTYDFVLIANTKDMQHYEEWSRKYLMDNPNVKHFYIHVVMDRVKTGYQVSL
jgi:DNA-binding Lrp family transcriptional regulator